MVFKIIMFGAREKALCIRALALQKEDLNLNHKKLCMAVHWGTGTGGSQEFVSQQAY